MIRITKDQSQANLGYVFTTVKKKPVLVGACEMNEDFEVETLEGLMTGKAGDFLLSGVAGELYPCKRDIFLNTYENV